MGSDNSPALSLGEPLQVCDKQRKRAVRKRWILTGSTSAVLKQLTLPMLWAILALFSADLIELYFASRLGVEELTAMSFSLPVQATLFAFAIGLGIVVATRLTQAKEVEQLAAVSLIFTVLVGATLAAVIWLGLQPMLTLLGFAEFAAREQVWPTLERYMQYRLGAVVFFFVVMVVFGVLRAFGNMRGAAQLLVTFAGLQIVMSAGLFTPWAQTELPLSGLERLGVAHFIAAVSASLYALYLLRIKENISLKVRLLSQRSRQAFRRLFRLFVPVVAMQLLTPLAQSLLMMIVASQGSDAVAAFGVVMRIEPLALLLPMVLTTSLPIFVGQNWAANKSLRVRRGIKQALAACLVWQSVIALVLFWGADMLGVGFCKQSFVSQSIELAMCILPVSYAALAGVMLYVSCCNAIGRSTLALNVTLVRLFVLSLPGAYLGAQLNGFQGIVWALALANFVVGAWLVYGAMQGRVVRQELASN
ncbi:MATE family efflux transporter [Pseudoalteromonas viridis]|uniref:MATE family efflux transporter n=1 Tax=Pseudoalteromonas viridis TaxID=339617 RepID=A0ABX7V0D2_9GAMM|nr:MATE family efflux transporter [Pseudoalteromonas viridis]QTL34331.1 hypothetical protein J5X90_12260 [Pseudoalteromonas viridis]